MGENYYRLVFIVLMTMLVAVSGWAQPTIDAKSYVLIDASTNKILAEKNADERLPPASLTKIMTAYLIFQALSDGRMALDDSVVVSKEAWASKVPGSKMFIEVGETVSIEDLLNGIIVSSGNDAAIALAQELAGDEDAFVVLMNKVAAGMDLKNTHFQNATGLPAENQYVSARDIATMVRRTIIDYPKSYQRYAQKSFTYANISQPNRNRLLWRFQGADGVKTGYTVKAGYSLASSAKRGERRLIAVVMKTASPAVRERESAKLLTFGFNAFDNHQVFNRTDRRALPLWQGEKDRVLVKPATEGLLTISRGVSLRIDFVVDDDFLVAPIEIDTEIGRLLVFAGEKMVLETSVVTAESVAEGDFWKRLVDIIKMTLGKTHELTYPTSW